ncbi:hypothetical protein [uncultured Psychroserpens sp.]|uniref:hypothetical protein n=1 Tax=uncultured Psychroserpens sp. TaxID=255436 RepID=UPI002608CB94|nr:hypothetical protein [uncultured Psychroserpens sp.]
MALIVNKPYSSGPYSVVDFIAGGHMFYYIYEFVLTILDRKYLKLEPHIIENRWMDDFDINRLKDMRSNLVSYAINERGYMMFSIGDENYMGRLTNNDTLVFSVQGKQGLFSRCYSLKPEQKGSLESNSWRHQNGRKFTL